MTNTIFISNVAGRVTFEMFEQKSVRFEGRGVVINREVLRALSTTVDNFSFTLSLLKRFLKTTILTGRGFLACE